MEMGWKEVSKLSILFIVKYCGKELANLLCLFLNSHNVYPISIFSVWGHQKAVQSRCVLGWVGNVPRGMCK